MTVQKEEYVWVHMDWSISEAEHGYASTAPMPEYLASKKKTKPKKSQGNRYVEFFQFVDYSAFTC